MYKKNFFYLHPAALNQIVSILRVLVYELLLPFQTDINYAYE